MIQPQEKLVIPQEQESSRKVDILIENAELTDKNDSKPHVD